MPKKLTLKELNVESFVTEKPQNVNGGITGNNTGCPTNNVCPISINNGCLETINDTCLSGESEYRTACEPKTQFPCYIDADHKKFKM